MALGNRNAALAKARTPEHQSRAGRAGGRRRSERKKRNSGLATRFPKGNVPWNKGTKRCLSPITPPDPNCSGLVGLKHKKIVKLAEQGNKCAICQRPFRWASETHYDHNHETNQFRGVLCTKCNTALGLFDEDQDRMLKAVEYLKDWNGKNG